MWDLIVSVPDHCLSFYFGGSHFYTYYSGFPCALICLSFMLMALDFSRKGLFSV